MFWQERRVSPQLQVVLFQQSTPSKYAGNYNAGNQLIFCCKYAYNVITVT